MSPGLLLGGAWLTGVYLITGKCSQGWAVLIAIAIFILFNVIFSYYEKTMLDLPVSRRTVHTPHTPRVIPRRFRIR